MKKVNPSNFILIIFACIIGVFSQVAGGYLLYTNAATYVRNSSGESLNNAARATAQIYSATLDNFYTRLDGYVFGAEVPNEFAYGGEVIDASATLSSGATFNFTAPIPANLREDKYNFYRLSEATNGAMSEGMCVIYSKSAKFIDEKDDKEKTKCTLLIQTIDSFYAEINDSSFESIALVSDSGRILASRALSGENVFNEYDGDTNVLFSDHAVTVEASRGGVGYLVSAAPVVGTEFYVVGFTANATLAAAQNTILIRTIIIIAACFAILLGCIALAAYNVRRNSEAVMGLNADEAGKFLLDIDRMGNITRSNKNFDINYERTNVFDSLVLQGDDTHVVDKKGIIMKIMNRSGEINYLSFIVTRMRNSFKLVGVDATSMFNKLSLSGGAATLGETEYESRFNSSVTSCERLFMGIIEVSNFNQLNLMFGREFSEKMVSIISERIKKSFDKVYKVGDNRLGVMVDDQHEIDYFLKDLTSTFDKINQSVLIDSNLVNALCHGGFVIVDNIMTDKTFSYAMNCANAALNRALKEDVRENYFIYHESQKKFYLKLLDKNWDIRKMLAADSFSMEFQPQYYITPDKPFGFEALFRIKKQLSLEVDIFELISYTERTGNMILLGEFIFNESMKFAKSVEDKGVHVSINVSPVQLMQAGFTQSFMNIYNKYDLKPGSISVEITESFLMTTFDETLQKLQILKSHGINIHLDDFGVSYSSMLYLKRLPIAAIKIDREFIKDIEKNNYSKAITKTIIDITKQLDLVCISEGVETEGQREILKNLGCDVIQGYLKGKSMPEDKARELLK